MQLVVIDTTGIQPYIFGSNRLRENIGGSHLVAEATGEWAIDEARKLKSNISEDRESNDLDDWKRIEDGEIEVEVVYSGGGNVVLLFRDDCEAAVRGYIGRLSRRVLQEAPGLQLIIESLEFKWERSLSAALRQAFQNLKVKKWSQPLQAPLAGLGVTVPCRSTGLPATTMSYGIGDDAGYPISPEIDGKLSALSEADKRLKKMLPLDEQYKYPMEFDDLGRSRGDFSYIAVVHADGNGIGQRIIDLGNDCRGGESNRNFIVRMREFSKAIETAAREALEGTLKELINLIKQGEIFHLKQPGLHFSLPKSKTDSGWFLPFRPLVFGGDDLTFVCDGRLGLSLTIDYLRRFEKLTANLPDGRGRATACAGVAIIKAHYPFARAYQLAEDLCKSAKSFRRQKKFDDACIDWHFATGGLFGDISEIRQREYCVGEGSLTLRPVTLSQTQKHWLQTWQVVSRGVESFQSVEWAERRNKVKALRDALRGGRQTVESFLLKYNNGNDLPDISPGFDFGNIRKTGWQDSCGYFDAIEMIDWYYPLGGSNEQA